MSYLKITDSSVASPSYSLRDVFLAKQHSGEEIKNNEMGEACSTYWGEKTCIKGCGGIPEEKRPFGRPRRILQDITKMDL
jgi:hypothetical protein